MQLAHVAGAPAHPVIGPIASRARSQTDAIASFTFVPVDPNAARRRPFAPDSTCVAPPRSATAACSYVRTQLSDAERREPASAEAPRLVSTHVHALAVGDQVMLGESCRRLRAPEGRPSAVLVAGGVGITPLFAMRNQAAKRPVTLLLYGVRHEREFFRRRGARGRAPLRRPSDRRGRARSALEMPRHLLLCGPGAMIDDLTAAVRWGPASIHYERALSRDAFSPEAALPECDVTFARTQRTVAGAPKARSSSSPTVTASTSSTAVASGAAGRAASRHARRRWRKSRTREPKDASLSRSTLRRRGARCVT